MLWLTDPRLQQAAERLAQTLRTRKQQLVLAESCTAGLVAAALGTVPGVSNYLCGSAVTYQIETKNVWLTPELTIVEANVVSEETARAMAQSILKLTPQADWGAAITGHLGPNAQPPELDGVIWISVANRDDRVESRMVRLQTGASDNPEDPRELRIRRQASAAIALLDFIAETIDAES